MACYQRAKYAADPEKGRQRARTRRQQNPEAAREADARWYRKNATRKCAQNALRRQNETPEERRLRLEYNRAYNAQYYVAKGDQLRAASREYGRQNRTAVVARVRAWVENNPDARRRYNAKYKAQNPDQTAKDQHTRRARKRNSGGTYSAAQWDDLRKYYGPNCPRCGAEEKLTVDHIVPIALGGTNYIHNLTPLCMRCNVSKGARRLEVHAPWAGVPELLHWVFRP